jgi:hypothetical protein
MTTIVNQIDRNKRAVIHKKVRKYCREHGINGAALAAETGLSKSCTGKLLAPPSNKNATMFLNRRTAEVLSDWLETNPERRKRLLAETPELLTIEEEQAAARKWRWRDTVEAQSNDIAEQIIAELEQLKVRSPAPSQHHEREETALKLKVEHLQQQLQEARSEIADLKRVRDKLIAAL